MKRLIVGSLLASGLLLANNHELKDREKMSRHDESTTRVEKMTTEENGNPRLSSNEEVALATQSPRVHLGNDKRPADRIVKTKNTIIAYIPYGK
jgi:hypothetical protein